MRSKSLLIPALIVFGGLIVALLGAFPGNRSIVVVGFVVAMISVTLPLVWFLIMPRLALTLAGGNRDRERFILQRIVNTPFPPAVKILARYQLGLNSQVNGHYSEAESLYQAILRDNAGDLEPGLESAVRQRLADTLEAIGQTESATIERHRSRAALRYAGHTPLGLQAQGKLFDRENRYVEAISVYERALELVPARNRQVRAELMLHIVLSSSNAGKPADVVRWAEAAIELDPRGPVSDSARRMAAVGYSNLGQLDKAEQHVRDALERAHSVEKRAESLAVLADYAMRRGDLDDAEHMAREADALLPGKKRMPWLVIGLIAKERGRLEEAILMFERVNSIPASHIPALNRRAYAGIQRDLAVLHAELGHHDTALALLREVEPELNSDPKRAIVLDASAALVHALRGDRELARERLTAAEEGLKRIPDDGTSRRSALSHLGRAALRIGEPERGESLLRRYLELDPSPVYLSYAYFHLAECRRMLGDFAGACSSYEKAASTGSSTRWERLALERLTAQDASTRGDQVNDVARNAFGLSRSSGEATE